DGRTTTSARRATIFRYSSSIRRDTGTPMRQRFRAASAAGDPRAFRDQDSGTRARPPTPHLLRAIARCCHIGRVMPISYDSAAVPVREDLVLAHARQWERLARPGTWWTGAERVAIAGEVRSAVTCELCRQRKASLS